MSTHRGNRSQKGQKNQEERNALAAQKRVAKWLITGTSHKDSDNKETIATVPTEWIYDYICEVVGQEPYPNCAPQQLDGTVTDIPNLYHFELFPREDEFS